jgi:hypothetical protein
VIPIGDITDEEVIALVQEASCFLSEQRWCERVGPGGLAFAIPGVLAVFRFAVFGRRPDLPPDVWVVVGDLPPAYIAQPPDSSWQDVVAGYVYEMRRWVTAVQAGSSVSDLIPVGIAPTLEYADSLAHRLDFIQTELLDVPADSIEGAV